jgi:hypothetical protein
LSIQFNECDLAIGYSGSAITSVSGSSGVALPDVVGQFARMNIPRGVRTFRQGSVPDDRMNWARGVTSAPIFTIRPVGSTSADTLRLVLARIFSGAMARSDTGSGAADTVQIVARPLTNSLDVAFYAPAATIISGLDWVMGRAQTPLEGIELVFVCGKASPGASTPAAATGTVTQLNTIYGF